MQPDVRTPWHVSHWFGKPHKWPKVSREDPVINESSLARRAGDGAVIGDQKLAPESFQPRTELHICRCDVPVAQRNPWYSQGSHHSCKLYHLGDVGWIV
eukprot:800237-Pyramimonas_sp.AAC.1